MNQIICGDALTELKKLPDGSIDTIITDPVWPNSIASLAGHADPYGLFESVAREFPRLAKTVVVHLGCTSDPRFLQAMPKELPYLRTCWLRYNFPSHRGRILVGSDVAYVFGIPPKARKGNHLLAGECKTPDSKMEIRIKKRRHPCPRKIDHVLWLVNVFSNPGDVVLDPFNGSGTTTKACQILGRRFIGIEIEKAYCQIAEERLAQQMLPIGAAA